MVEVRDMTVIHSRPQTGGVRVCSTVIAGLFEIRFFADHTNSTNFDDRGLLS